MKTCDRAESRAAPPVVEVEEEPIVGFGTNGIDGEGGGGVLADEGWGVLCVGAEEVGKWVDGEEDGTKGGLDALLEVV